MLALRPYQREAKEAFWDRVFAGLRRGIIQLPTGTGKTLLAAAMARELGGRTLWIAHRDELIEQPRRTFAAVWPEASVGVVKAEQDEADAQVVLASIQTIYQPHRLRRLGAFDFVVVDEAHHAVAPTWRRTLVGVGGFRPDGPPVLGLTATVERGDQLALGEVFEEVVYQLQLLEAIRQGWLVDLRFQRVVLNVDFDAITTVHGDFHQGQLADALLGAQVAEKVADAYLQHGQGRKALVFTVSVEQARRTAEALRARGVAAEWVAGETPLEERRAVLRRLHTGETTVVANCAVLTEGFDEPSVSCIVVARPTQSKTLYLQMIGRGTRIHPPYKQDCLVIDVAGVSERHTVVQAPALFGLDPDAVQGKRALEALDEPQLRPRTSPPEARLLRASQQLAGREAFHWLAEDDLYVLPAGSEGSIVLLPEASETYSVWLLPRDKHGTPQLLFERPVWLELAQGIAEDYVRRMRQLWAARPDRLWRHKAAGERQIEAARRWGIAVRDGMTRGELSDAITLAIAKAYRRRLREARERVTA